MSSFLAENKKTHSCGALRASDDGTRAVLTGWVDNYRDHGGCVFIDLRDREGITQVVFDKEVDEASYRLAGELRAEFCVGVVGKVRSRGANVNPKLATGEIEVVADTLDIFSRAETPPSYSSGGPSGGPLDPGSASSEFTKSRKTLSFSSSSASGMTPARSSTASVAKIGVAVRTARAMASDGRASIS